MKCREYVTLLKKEGKRRKLDSIESITGKKSEEKPVAQRHREVSGSLAHHRRNQSPKGIVRSAVPSSHYSDVFKFQRVAGQRYRPGRKFYRILFARPFVRTSKGQPDSSQSQPMGSGDRQLAQGQCEGCGISQRGLRSSLRGMRDSPSGNPEGSKARQEGLRVGWRDLIAS